MGLLLLAAAIVGVTGSWDGVLVVVAVLYCAAIALYLRHATSKPLLD